MNRGVIFDKDGTLVDSNYFHALALYRAFAEVGEEVPMYRIHRAIGMGSQQLSQLDPGHAVAVGGGVVA